MRRSSLGLALSAAAHVAAVGLWLVWPSSCRVDAAELAPRSAAPIAPLQASPSPPSAPSPPVPEDQVIELAIVELPPEAQKLAEELTAAVPPVPQRPLPRQELATRRAEPLGTTLAAGAAETTGPTTEAQPGDAPAVDARSALSMRNALPTRLAVPDLRKIAERGPIVAIVAPVPMSPELEPAGGGRYRSDKTAFTANVNRDGSVVFEDKPNLRVSVADPRDVGKAVKKGLADWAKNPYGQTRDKEREAEQNRVPSGAVDDEEEQRKRPKTVALISGSFDLTDWAMRVAGRDPYWAAKLAFMDRTRESRAQLAVTYRAELLRNVVTMVRAQAKRVWSDPTQTAVQRRRALFELWDDCAESGAESDEPLVEAARRARVALYGFIRAKAPADGPDAYSADELAALNRARHSRQLFAPYDDLPAP